MSDVALLVEHIGLELVPVHDARRAEIYPKLEILT